MASNDFSLDRLSPSLFLFTADILEDMIHLLEGSAPRLRNEEKGPGE